MVVVDSLSKYAHLCALQHPFTTSMVAQLFMDQVFKLHGMSHSIFLITTQLSPTIFGKNCSSYKAPIFISAQLIIPRLMVKHKLSTSVWTYFRCFALEKKNHWAQWLTLTEWWYNTSYHTTTRMTPFEAVYGQKPPLVLSYLSSASKVQSVDLTLTA